MQTLELEPLALGGATSAVAAFAAEFAAHDLSEAEETALWRHILDTLGVAVAGCRSPAAGIAERALPQAPGTSIVPGLPQRYEHLAAAYLFGVAAHSLELDDGSRAGSVHPGTVVIPAAFAAAGPRTTGADLMKAVAVGYQTVVAVAEVLNPHARGRGFHNTPVAGVLGATMAAGSLAGLDADQMQQALGVAASSAAGLFAFLLGGGEVKRLHAGFAAREGVFAARLAHEGMTGPRAVLEGPDGFFQAFAGVAPPESFADAFRLPRPAAPLKVTQCYLKPYACCRHIHPAIDAVIDIVAAEGLAPERIRRIACGTYAIAAEHAKAGWDSMAEAQLSYPFSVATAVRRRGVGVEDFSPAARSDPQTLALCRKVEVSVDPARQAAYPGERGATVTVTTDDGRSFIRHVAEPSGSTRAPLTDAQVTQKFLGLAAPGPDQARAERVVELVKGLGALERLDALFEALSGD